ncbi:MAG: hypothetical protein COB02_10500 [Candidatus Cloacimonadota bacterium]|nr:MAG: hypothetical protein COB02_10500 [Candidatus Cloacimonadota bacterium]
MGNKKNIPAFKTENEERDFWDDNCSSEFVDWGNAEQVCFPKLKPSLKTISMRMPESMIFKLKSLANVRDVPYQSLMKIFL